MNNKTIQIYSNLFSAVIYFIIAMLVCVVTMETQIIEVVFVLGCTGFIALTVVYLLHKKTGRVFFGK